MIPDHELTESQQYIEKLTKEYIAKHIERQERDELIAEDNIEKRDIKGYHGREILELLQNADDAYQKSIDMGEKPDCELEVIIEYKNNVLTVINTGTFFDKDGIKAIVQGNNSPKTGKYIGNKGTGFRSVLNWAEKVRIFSGCFDVEFSKEIADRKLDEIRKELQIEKQLKKNPNLYIPMLAVPANIENHKRNDRTTIEIVIDPQKLDDDCSVLQQIENIDLRILLFLPNIGKIDIITEKNHIIYKRRAISGVKKNISLLKIVDDNTEVEESFFLFEKTIEHAIKEDDVFKDFRLSIAVPKNFGAFSRRYVYSFFPLLDTESPFNCVLHATYALDDHRNTINMSPANKEIIREQLAFLIDVSKEFVQNGNYDIAYKLLVPSNFSDKGWRFTSPFSKFELEDYYLELLALQKIFLTVNDEYISVKDNPKMIIGDYPELFSGKVFNSLLKPIQDEGVKRLIEVLAKREDFNIYFEEKHLLEAVNKLTDSWNVSQQVDVFIWWNKYYKSSLPNLLKTQEGKWLSFNEECYFLIGDFSAKEGLPSWVKIPALRRDYQQELFSKSEQSQEVIKIKERGKETQIFRILSQNRIYPTINFKYRDRSNIISTVNASVDNYDKAIDFVRWLWGNYRHEDGWNPPGRSEGGFKYNFPCCQDKSIKDSEKLFLGLGYGNDLAGKLFDANYAAFPPGDVFGINKSEAKEFIEFVRKFGVKEYPAVEIQEVYPIDSYARKYEVEIKRSGALGASTRASYEYRLPFIKNLEDILMRLSYLDIVKWIARDSVLYTYLCNPLYSSDAQIRYYGNLQQYYRQYSGKIENYILEVFNEVKWIEIGEKRYSPRQILQSFNSKNNQKFIGVIPVISTEMLETIAEELEINYNEVHDIFEKFSFADKITDLSSEDFYGLLLRLPELDFSKSVELSRTIYRIIEQASFTKNFENFDNKKRFLKEGKVLVKYQGQLQYYLVKEAYLPSSNIISKKDFPIVEKGQRTNNANFARVLGCREYNKEYSVVKDSIVVSRANDSFQRYYRDFQKYARAYAERNDNIERHGKNLIITLVREISILEGEKIINITDEYMCVRDTLTNWYVTVYDSDFVINTISEIIENIYSNIANTSGFDAGKLGELFRAGEKRDRDFLIRKEFGSLNLIDDANYKNEIRNNFMNALNKIDPAYAGDEIGIDFDDFSNIKNAPCIIELFAGIGTDMEGFKEAGFVYAIDLVPYFKKELRNFIQTEAKSFKDALFTRAVHDESMQKDFIKTVNKFMNFSVILEYENSVAFHVEDKVINEFGEWRSDGEKLSADKVYAQNYDEMNPDERFKDEIANDEKAQCMIYFHKVEAFEEWLERHEKQEYENTDRTYNPYSRFVKIVPKRNEISYHKGANVPTGSSHSSQSGYHVGAFTYTADEKRRRNQKVSGNIGELLIYNLLCQSVGKDNVHPRSEAFVELEILKPGQAISGEYDISYIDKNGTEYFVEVKTGDGNSFIISPGELEFAIENADRYKLYLVFNVDADKPDYRELPAKFWEDARFRRKEIVERIVYEF